MAISSYNKGSIFNVNTEGMKFEKMEDLYNLNGAEKVYTLTAVFINTKSNFGPRPVGVTPEFMVDFPNHTLPEVQQILQDPDTIQQIKEGKAGFQIRAYMSKTYNKECFTPHFVDL